MNRTRHQTGAFILATVVFLMVAGSVMLYAMTNLSVVTSATTSVTHNGNMALMAAQSGLKYCVAQLEGEDICAVNPEIDGVSSPSSPCKIILSITPINCISGICKITSAAYCPKPVPLDPPDPPKCDFDDYYGAKKLTMQVQKTTGGVQMIPASRQVETPETLVCP